MKGISVPIFGIALLAYAIYGYYSGQLYVPGKYTSGSYVTGERLLFVFMSYIFIAIASFIFCIPTKPQKIDRSELAGNSFQAAMLMKSYRFKILTSPKFLAIYVTLALAVLFLFGSLFYNNG
jgi:hypothetical protein